MISTVSQMSHRSLTRVFAGIVALGLTAACTSSGSDESEGSGDGLTNAEIALTSPDGRLSIAVRLDRQNALEWQVESPAGVVIGWSPLGLELEGTSFATNVSVDGGSVSQRSCSVDLVAGKRRAISAVANEVTVEVSNDAGNVVALDLVAFDDAVAHRWRLISDPLTVLAEPTAFRFAPESTKYVQAYDRTADFKPASESLWSKAIDVSFSMPAIAGWSLPALFDTPGGWALITETGVDGQWYGSRLVNDRTSEHRLAPPLESQGDGPVEVIAAEPYALPWRLVMVADEAAGIVESSATELLAAPSQIGDTSWIKPGRVSWGWWSESDSPRDPDALRRFIDLAAEFGWEYSLIDANWNLMDDEVIPELIAYAAERNVGIFLWYNSGGPHNRVTEQPRDRMTEQAARREELEWLRDIGVVGIKVDFFQSDKASMNQLALDILADTAEFELLANFHGITHPKGWHVTWPHLMTTEAVAGAEQYKFDRRFPELAPRHNTVLAFTRNVVGPMDYTPMTLSDSEFAHITTAAHELALGVLFESGLQHPADTPSAYRGLDPEVHDFLRRMPVVWDDVRVLAGTPADHVVMARRHGDEWWIAGINGTDETRSVTIDLAEFGNGFTVVQDGSGRDGLVIDADASGSITVDMAPAGGFFAWPK